MVRLCWLLWLAVALAAPETPPRPSEPGSGSGSGVPAGAAANNLAGQLAHQIWQILQGSVTAPPGMLSGPSASEAAAPSVGAPGHSAPTHEASSSTPGPLPAATNPPGPTEESEEPAALETIKEPIASCGSQCRTTCAASLGFSAASWTWQCCRGTHSSHRCRGRGKRAGGIQTCSETGFEGLPRLWCASLSRKEYMFEYGVRVSAQYLPCLGGCFCGLKNNKL